MQINKFEDIIAWQKSQELVRLIYTLLGTCRDFGFRDQIQRAVISVSNNIAEGFERQGNNELRRFLYIAKGSCAEVRSMTYLAETLHYFSPNDAVKMRARAEEISKMLSGFIKHL